MLGNSRMRRKKLRKRKKPKDVRKMKNKSSEPKQIEIDRGNILKKVVNDRWLGEYFD